MSYGKRHSIYLRKDKDRDLIEYIDVLLHHCDFAAVARSLMRDGIKYRSAPHTHVESIVHPDIQSEPKTAPPTIKLNKIEVSEDELENRLNEF